RSVRVREKTVGQIANEMSLGNRSDDAQLILAVTGVVVDEFADPRLRVVGGDEGELVRVFTRAFDCAYQDFLHFHKETHPSIRTFSCLPFSCLIPADRKMADRKMSGRRPIVP